MTCTVGLRTVTCGQLVVAPDCNNIYMPYGTDNELQAIIKDGDGKAVPITSDTVTLTVKDSRGGAVVFTKSNGPGSHSDPAQGETIFPITPADTATADSYAVTTWVYEVRRVTGGGDVYSHLTGRFIVEPTI